jgi:hypothetical protein
MIEKVGLYFEKFIGMLLGLLTSIELGCLICKNPKQVEFLSDDKLYDKLITISTTLFGFLLAVLTLIIQGNSHTINEMKEFGSFDRLIKFNRDVVITSAIVCVLSLVLGYCKEMFCTANPWIFNILSLLDIGIFVWTLVNVFIFVILFYQILLSDSISSTK